MESFEFRGLRLRYLDRGEGRPLVFLHGLGGGMDQILNTLEPLPDLRLIVPEMEGHGESEADWENYGFSRLAEDLAALMDRLGVKLAAMAGISMGAAVCLRFALDYPERVESLLLIRNAWGDCPMAEPVVRAYADLGRCLREGGEAAFRQTESWDLVKEPSAYTRAAFLKPFSQPDNLRNWQKYLILPPQQPVKNREELSSLRMPVRILANRSDLCHPYALGERLAALIPGADFFEIPDKDSDPAGHKAQLNRLLRDWLKVSYKTEEKRT